MMIKYLHYLDKRDKELYEKYKEVATFEAQIILILLEEKAKNTYSTHCNSRY